MTPEHLPTEQYEAQLAEKVVRLQKMMAPFSAQVPEVFRSPVSHYRMRAEFRLWHDGDDLYHIMFDQQTKSRIRVDTFPAASELINQLMAAVIEGVRDNPVLRHKLFQVDYLTTLSNQAVISLLYHKKLDDEWRQQAERFRDALRAQNLNVHLIGRATKTKIELDQAIAFLNRKAGEVELRRYRLVGAGRDTVTAAIFAEAQAVVWADDPFFVVKTERQRHAAVGTDVASDHHLALDTIDNQLFIKQGGFYRRGADIAGAGDRMPAFRQAQPVLGLKGAMGGRGGLWFVHGFSSCSQKHLFNCCEFIVAILGC